MTGKPDGRVTGFDLSSGPDQTASATMRRHKVGDRYEYSLEDIKTATHPDLERMIREQADAMRWHRDQAFERAMWGNVVDPPWGFEAPRHWNCRSGAYPGYEYGAEYETPGQEIIPPGDSVPDSVALPQIGEVAEYRPASMTYVYRTRAGQRIEVGVRTLADVRPGETKRAVVGRAVTDGNARFLQ